MLVFEEVLFSFLSFPFLSFLSLDLKYKSSALLELHETANIICVSKPLPRWPSKALGHI